MALYIWLALCAWTAVATAVSIVPTNWTDANENGKVSGSIGLSVSQGERMVLVGPILALTQRAHNGIPPTGFSGPIFSLDPSSQLQLSESDVALISCDTYPGEIQADTLLGVAEKTNVTSIVFYTQTADYCRLDDFAGTYSWIYTTKSRAETTQVVNSFNSPDPNPDGQVYASVNNLASAAAANGTSGGGNGDTSNNQDNGNPLGPSPSTAVAMIILYSITGLITALFLVIIITGAVRAHRHPERYGPRNIIGRPRQSRARGLGRAIVDTLPIVKFGERQEPKPTDVELADNPTERPPTADRDVPAAEDHTENATDASVQQAGQPRESVEGGIAAAVNTDQAQSGADKPENLGCSICTEDFEAGQDQRVLPCDHRFHPECIDPWLLNVSGTCPLCRIDLRPSNEDAEEGNELDENGNPALREGQPGDLAPPLGNGEATAERQRMGIRRSLLIGLMGVRGPDRMTQEERVNAARQLRRQHLATLGTQPQAGPAESEETQQSRRARLRRVFGIRTRQAGQADEPAQPDEEQAESSSRNQDSSAR